MTKAYNISENTTYKLICNETVQLPPFANILEMVIDASQSTKMPIRFIFSSHGKEFSLVSRKSNDGKYLEYFFYNWNSENFVDLKKPLIITKNNGEITYWLYLSTKINLYTNIRTVIYTLWQIL